MDRSPHNAIELADVDELMRQDGWLRRLARQLVRDGSEADDLAQQAMLAALERQPRPGQARGFLATVARRLAATGARRAVRRRHHEQQLDAPAPAPSTDELLHRLDIQKRVTAAVAELPEPDRTAVLLRFFEDLEPAEIAARTGASSGAIRQRCHRGLQRVRERLARDLGPDWRTRAGLLALLRPSSQAAAPRLLLAATLMTKTRMLVVAALVLIMSAAFLVPYLFDREQAPPAAAQAEQQANAPDAAPAVTAGDPASAMDGIERTAAAPVEPGDDAPAVMADAEVFWSDGSPASGVGIGIVPLQLGSATHGRSHAGQRLPEGDVIDVGVTDAEGKLRFELVGKPGHLAPLDPGLIARHTSNVAGSRPPTRGPARLVLARAIDVRGIVVGPDRQPLEGVEVSVELQRLFEFPKPLENTTRVDGKLTTTDGSGVFTAMPAIVDGSRLRFELEGYRTETRDVTATAAQFEVVMTPYGDDRRWLVGTVTDPRMLPVANAQVGIDQSERVTTDDYGRYELDITGTFLADSSRLFAARPGSQPAVVGDLPARVADRGATRVDLQLGPAAVQLRGRVLEADGSPAPAGLVVYPWDRPAVGWGSTREELAVDPAIESLHLGGPELRAYGKTDTDGEFSIAGMQPHTEYVLRVYDQAKCWAVSSRPVRVGDAEVEIRLPAERWRDRLVARVVDRHGHGIANASVGMSVEVFRSGGSTNWLGKPLGTTDGEGRLQVTDVPRLGLRLTVSGDGIVGTGIDVPEDHAADEIRIEVRHRCFVRVVAPADRNLQFFSVLDADGNRLRLTVKRSGASSSSTRQRLEAGRTIVLAVADSAQTAVFYDGDGNEVSRMPMAVTPGEVTVVRP